MHELLLAIQPGDIWDSVVTYMPMTIAFIGVCLVFLGARIILLRQAQKAKEWRVISQVIQFLIPFFGLIVIVLTAPLSPQQQGNILNMLAIMFSAILALSSATIIGNILAGVMLRIVNNFRPGDFIEIGDDYGRVSERGMFHTELQTINSDLITLPNLYVITHPVRVKRSAGTFISATVSLGYDVPRKKVESALLEAAKCAGLEDAFCNINELGDYSIVYEIFGRLDDVKKVISGRSLLRAMMLDALHADGIEIVSPTFMNQRQVNEVVFIPTKSRLSKNGDQLTGAVPEDKIFEKADEAGTIDELKQKIKGLEEKLKEHQAGLKAAADEKAKTVVERSIKLVTIQLERAREQLDVMQQNTKG